MGEKVENEEKEEEEEEQQEKEELEQEQEEQVGGVKSMFPFSHRLVKTKQKVL